MKLEYKLIISNDQLLLCWTIYHFGIYTPQIFDWSSAKSPSASNCVSHCEVTRSHAYLKYIGTCDNEYAGLCISGQGGFRVSDIADITLEYNNLK